MINMSFYQILAVNLHGKVSKSDTKTIKLKARL